MILDEQQKTFLSAVRIFSKTQRYHGMMPRWVVDSCNQSEVRKAFAQGCVAYSSIDADSELSLEGLILTDKGCKALES